MWAPPYGERKFPAVSTPIPLVLSNAGFSEASFADERSVTVETELTDPVVNPEPAAIGAPNAGTGSTSGRN